MKRLSIVFAFICFVMAMVAQETIKVKYHGAKPSITDFAEALLFASENGDESDCNESLNAMANSYALHKKGMALPADSKLTIDQKNGYIVYETRYEEHLLRVEMCYWNDADQKHKLFACNVTSFSNGVHSPGQYDGVQLYRYTNATKKMTWQYNDFRGIDDNGNNISYELPRTGKDITAKTWLKNGTVKKKIIKWNGHGFNM